MCDTLELGHVVTNRATDLASQNCPPRLNFHGGLPLWVLTCSVAANEHGDLLRMKRGAFREFREEYDLSTANLAAATDLVREVAYSSE